jgi:hypothetical protein
MHTVRIGIWVVLLLFSFAGASLEMCPAQQTDPSPAYKGMVCTEIQRQVDEIVAIGNSKDLTDEEKISKLMASWMASFAAIGQMAKDDSAVLEEMGDLGKHMTGLLSEAQSSQAAGTQEPSGKAKQDLNKINQIIKPYLAMVKSFCPQLKLPDLAP